MSPVLLCQQRLCFYAQMPPPVATSPVSGLPSVLKMIAATQQLKHHPRQRSKFGAV